MRKLSFFLLFTYFQLHGALFSSINNYQAIEVLQAFDIEPSFLHDAKLQEIIVQKREEKVVHFFSAMEQAYQFMPNMKMMLSKENLPSQFLFLAMAESGFSTKAYSKKRASGIWQFMTYTGQLYGLRIDDYVDERRDLLKSTQSAIVYIHHLHNKFGKWYLAALAYNCGEGRLSRAIKRAKSDELSVLLDEKKRYLPRESRRYIRKICALAIIGNDERYLTNNQYGYLLNRAGASSIVSVEVSQGDSLKRIAKTLNVDMKVLKNLNRQLNYDFIPPDSKPYTIYIPYTSLRQFKQQYSAAHLSTIYKIHRVTSGDNLSYLGKKYHIPYKLIKDFNHLKSDRLSIKQKLIIPVPKKAVLARDGYYTVKSGDTLISIAKKHNTSVSSLMNLNHLASSRIQAGEKIALFD